MSETLLSVENLSMKFGGLVAVDNLNFDAKKTKSPQSLALMVLVKQLSSIV